MNSRRLFQYYLLFLTLGQCFDKVKSIIVGGTEVEVGRYPFAVSIVDGRETQFCGGVLISSTWVLTAAHCGIDRAAYVQIGRHNIDNKEEEFENIPIIAEYEHPDWCPDTMEYDFMLIQLEYDSEFEPIRLPDSNTAVDSTVDVTVVGWGPNYFGGPNSDILMKAELDVVDNLWCEQLYKEVRDVTDDMMCASREELDACEGDSGGPLFIEDDELGDTLVGIVSWGTFCADPSYPSVYARVTKAKQWIKEIIENNGNLRISQLFKYRTKRMFKGLRR